MRGRGACTCDRGIKPTPGKHDVGNGHRRGGGGLDIFHCAGIRNTWSPGPSPLQVGGGARVFFATWSRARFSDRCSFRRRKLLRDGPNSCLSRENCEGWSVPAMYDKTRVWFAHSLLLLKGGSSGFADDCYVPGSVSQTTRLGASMPARNQQQIHASFTAGVPICRLGSPFPLTADAAMSSRGYRAVYVWQWPPPPLEDQHHEHGHSMICGPE